MKKIFTIILTFFMIILAAGLASAAIQCENSSLPITVQDTTDLSGTEFIEKGWTLTPKIRLTSDEYVDDIEITAHIFGYEYFPIEDRLKIFDMDPEVLYFKRFKISTFKDMDPGLYKVRYVVANRDGESMTCYAKYYIGSQRHEIQIKDVDYKNIAEAGNFLDVDVKLENIGQKYEDSILVTASIPYLNTSTSLIVDGLDSETVEHVEGLYLSIPRCTIAGDYTLWIEARYNEGTQVSTETFPIKIAGNLCDTELFDKEVIDSASVTLDTSLQDSIPESQKVKQDPVNKELSKFKKNIFTFLIAAIIGLIMFIIFLIFIIMMVRR